MSKRNVDYGKIFALHKAGWTGKQIAEELGLTMEEYCKALTDLLDKLDAKIKPLERKYKYIVMMLKI